MSAINEKRRIDLDALKMEFNNRYYRWAGLDFEREISEQFSGFKLFSSGSAFRVYRFMQQLSASDQLTLARGLLKKFHREAATALEERPGPREDALLSSLKQYRRRYDPLTQEAQLAVRAQNGEKIRFASKRSVRSEIVKCFKVAFGSGCVGTQYLDDCDDVVFDLPIGSWIIHTYFDFGRYETALSYGHSISNRLTFSSNDGGDVAIVSLASFVSFNSWLGVSSQTEWSNIFETDVDHACSAAVTLCRRFFDGAPVLLDGLKL